MLNSLRVDLCNVLWDADLLEELCYETVALLSSGCHGATRLGEFDSPAWLSLN
jgi:hypothetical protein